MEHHLIKSLIHHKLKLSSLLHLDKIHHQLLLQHLINSFLHSLILLQGKYMKHHLLLHLHYSYMLTHPYILEFEHIHMNHHLNLHQHYNSMLFHLYIQVQHKMLSQILTHLLL